ncbi:MAG: helix-turn-helix domain-containing protein [Candidatus Thorarchaeota archaeon]
MPASDATLKALKELGLTEYETAAYLALIEGGQMSASEVSAKSDVPYSRVYDVLGRLEQKAFIQVQRGRPTRYIARAPTEVVRLVRLSWEDRIDRSAKTVIEELQPLYEKETQATPRDVMVIYGRSAILSKALEILDSANVIKLSLPRLDLEVKDLTQVIEHILGVKAKSVQILTSFVSESIIPLIPDSFEVRTRERVFGAGLVADDKTLIMLLADEEEHGVLGVFSNHAVFAAMASAYFESLWAESIPVE